MPRLPRPFPSLPPPSGPLLAALLLLVAGCDVFEMQREGLYLESRAGALLIGDTIRVGIELLGGSAPASSEVRWMSSNDAVATVDGTGLVTAAGRGPVEISARVHGLTATLPLWIWEPAPPFVSIALGSAHSCGLDVDGRAWCWGADWDGQVGSSSVPDRCMPTAPLPCSTGALPVLTDLRFRSLALGANHSCGLTASGEAHCWGANAQGQLGDGGTTGRWRPEPVSGGHAFRGLAAGSAESCGITEGGELLCWGSGTTSPSGPSGPGGGPAVAPLPGPGGDPFVQVAVASGHACALTAEGATWCWGRNDHGQLGVEGAERSPEPRRAASAPPFASLSLAGEYSCGLTEGGAAYCWGRNDAGQLGDGTTEGRWEARPVLGGKAFWNLAAGSAHACGLAGEGELFCWGRDRASFGTGGEPMETPKPVRSAPGLRFGAIDAASGHTCGVADTGITWCWGSNSFGSLGSGGSNRMPVTAPVRVVRRSDVP